MLRSLLVVTLLAGTASAQDAKSVLGNVQQYYAKTPQLTAKFEQDFTKAAFEQHTKSSGTLYVLKPSSFRFDYAQKKKGASVVTKTFTFDGTTLWFVDKLNKRLYQHTTQKGSALPAAVSFLTGGNTLAEDFDVALTTKSGYGSKDNLVLELTPKQASAQYAHLYFVVAPKDWHITESVVVASNGDINDFKLYAPDVKTSLEKSLFAIDPKALPTFALTVVKDESALQSP